MYEPTMVEAQEVDCLSCYWGRYWQSKQADLLLVDKVEIEVFGIGIGLAVLVVVVGFSSRVQKLSFFKFLKSRSNS